MIQRHILKLLPLCLLLLTVHITVAQKNKTINFHPSVYYRSFSSTVAPVLNIIPGDTVNTESIDAGGFDKNGKKVSEGGNPLTGPFYIEGVSEGDVLAVTLLKVAFNRNYATTFELFVKKSVPKEILKQLPRRVDPVDWHLYPDSGFAAPKAKYENFKDFKVPLKPFLGCVGVAPKGKAIRTYFAGPFGGNLDFDRVTEGATVYIPVFNKGALLYMGDAHAVQGDGEITGSALETSMDFTFTVKVIKKEFLQLSYPRIEDSVYIMAIGIDKSLDNALKIATEGLLNWLQMDYRLSLQEASQVMGPAIEYTIAAIAGRDAHVVAKVKKEILKGLKQYK